MPLDQLQPEERRKLHQALLNAFPSPTDLEMMLYFCALNKNLNEIVTGQNHAQVIFKLIQWAEANGKVEELLIAACEPEVGRPNNSKLKPFCQKLNQTQLVVEQPPPLEQTINTSQQFDIFLCHNSQDKDEVRKVREALQQQGFKCFLDEYLSGGELWRQSIARAIRNSRYVVIFVGGHGLGQYQRKEIEYCDGIFFDGIKVIPVLLSTATKESIQTFHSQDVNWIWRNQRVDFRSRRDSDPMGKIIQAISGKNSSNQPPVNTQPKSNPITIKKPPPEDDLSSEKGVDYTQLRDFLKAQNWKAADKETLKVMLQAANRQEEGWLDYESIENFPCTDLRTIDQLWVRYSDGHFGFSVQKRIWLECGGKGKVNYEMEKALGDALGWRKNNSWLDYNDITFTLNAPVGHLPISILYDFHYLTMMLLLGVSDGNSLFWRIIRAGFFSRVSACEV
ncbi:GUN4 domain-containing protein [Mastigocoleus sp. MO_188.B34]|uniref:GUN4 domain-containing protein n=1 Tax=Mastigocoleus sp. MO_188.B34 TaxID=3036635 RepID=UPI00262794D9|nr:GUN4 domain-containing protein [Mastigocoleus sp. MO_188.B34]MDJ0695845.1 GUN4 domain-containing protein [Mastigocoleus sp. MO_188.B34]